MARRVDPAPGAGTALAAPVVPKFTLGVLTLLGSVPIPLAALHQAGAVLLLGLSLVTLHRLTSTRTVPSTLD